MTLYVDTSAVLKRYFAEPDMEQAIELMAAHPVLVTSALTELEGYRNLSLHLDASEFEEARARFRMEMDWMATVALDAATQVEAIRVAEETGCRSLDAIHLASALRAGAATTLLTYDARQARAARELGMTVVGG